MKQLVYELMFAMLAGVLVAFIYAAVVGVFFTVFELPRRMRCSERIRRGLCPACAYPVGKSATCTECGQPVVML